jgi:hypothetical protein
MTRSKPRRLRRPTQGNATVGYPIVVDEAADVPEAKPRRYTFSCDRSTCQHRRWIDYMTGRWFEQARAERIRRLTA